MIFGNILLVFMVGFDVDLVWCYLFVICLDVVEFYVLLVMGYIVFWFVVQLVLCKFEIVFKVDVVIEYVIWYDWDIQYFYDFEYVWVYIDVVGVVVVVEVLFYGLKVLMDLVGGVFKLEGGCFVLYVELGKYVYWVDGYVMVLYVGDKIIQMCGLDVGKEVVYCGNLFFVDGCYGMMFFVDCFVWLKMKCDVFVL